MESKKKIKTLCLCGGGIYGYGEVGAITEMEKYSEYLDIKNIKGVSVGSIVAALYAVGYTSTEMTKILYELNFDFLIRGSSVFSYFRFYEKYGLYEAEGLEEEIEKLIRQKTNIKYCTFSQISKNLTIISTNLNYQRPRFFNKNLTPDMIISKAVRMSIAYPGIITPVLFENDWYGDGGETMNYPIITVDNLDETIGITFATFDENNDGTLKNRLEINNVYDYISSVALTMSRSIYVSQINQKHLDRSIIVHITKDFSTMQFFLKKEDKEFIYNCGIAAVREQFNKILG